ncbi:hypothetical protein DL96DRAFT_1581524 [Flagelloscypha sp. PMI_526]|nr:hypothetical protein DL96DRAFT_1581524 [Flagelloscypha sp. PMI_526]
MLWPSIPLLFVTFLSTEAMPLLGQRQAFPLGNPDLSKNPSTKDPMTLFRGISNSEELASTRGQLGKQPVFTSSSFGDYNADGSPVLYFWSDKDDADIWCEHRLSSEQRERHGITQCAVATYDWKPPANVRVKRFTKGDTEWQGFVRDNWRGPGMPVAPIQQDNDWIEGPLSSFIGGDYWPNGINEMQYALVSTLMLPHLTITDVSQDFECLDCRPDGGLGTMPMYEDFNSQIIKRVDPVPEPTPDPPSTPAIQPFCEGDHAMAIAHFSGKPEVREGKESFIIIDSDCRVSDGQFVTNVCTDTFEAGATLGCSPEPITINAIHNLLGKEYTCTPSSRLVNCKEPTKPTQIESCVLCTASRPISLRTLTTSAWLPQAATRLRSSLLHQLGRKVWQFYNC